MDMDMETALRVLGADPATVLSDADRRQLDESASTWPPLYPPPALFTPRPPARVQRAG